MDSRSAAAVTIAALLTLAGCAGGSSRDRELGVGDRVPPAWAPAVYDSAAGTELVWLFRTEDCLNCQNIDYAVRRVQQVFGSNVPLVTVHVGDPEDSWIVDGFFRRRRVRVDRRVQLSPREFRRTFGDALLPAVYVVRGRTVAWSSLTNLRPGERPVSLDTVVQRIRERRRAR